MASLQGSRGQVISILINFKGGNGAYHPSIYVVSCSIVQWDGINDGTHQQCNFNLGKFAYN